MKEQIRLEKIYVKRLFNRFTYDINLNNGNDVAIFIAPNGCGKTTVFNLVEYIFNPTFEKNRFISRTPFEICTCVLSNGTTISLEKREYKVDKKDEKYRKPPYTPVVGLGMGQLYEEHKHLILTINDGKVHEMNLSEEMMNLSRKMLVDEMPDAYSDRIMERLMENPDLNPEDILPRSVRNRYMHMRANGEMVASGIKEFIKKYGCNIEVNFITADRLHKSIPTMKFEDRGRFRGRNQGLEERENDPLGTIQDNFTMLYSVTDEKYNKLVSEARDRLPKMYLDIDDKNDLPEYKSFKKEWQEYVDEMERFREIGLMDEAKQILKMSELEDAFKDKGAFLSVYLKVFKSTLKPWKEQYDKLKLFIDILNRRNQVTLKELKYSSNGLKLFADGVEIPLECMSSGEKNDLIMFYNLIFNSQNGGLVLVDEPEISLHIEWQEEYIDRLLSICKMNQLQAVVATHSPNIVNGHFELYADRRLEDERRGN